MPTTVRLHLQRLLGDQRGAVTIDWVAITAGIILLGLAVVYGIYTSGVDSLTGDVNSTLVNQFF